MESFLEKLLEAPEKENVELVDTNVSNFCVDAFNHQISNTDKMTEHQIFNFIKSNIDYICKGVFDGDRHINSILTNPRFMKVFSQVIVSMPITYERQLTVNKICYDYLTSDLNDSNIKTILLDMCRVVNHKQIQDLMAIGLDPDTSNNLAMCRYSSMTEKINVKRLNFVICSKDPDIMTEQMIVWIYEKLFNQIGELFNATMLDYYVPDGVQLTDSFMENYSTISLALLTIVNNMPISDINKIIRNYIQDWEYASKPAVRISLRSLSADFGRITQVVEYLNAARIYVP